MRQGDACRLPGCDQEFELLIVEELVGGGVVRKLRIHVGESSNNGWEGVGQLKLGEVDHAVRRAISARKDESNADDEVIESLRLVETSKVDGEFIVELF